jgi:predicted nucleotidyltransferase
VSGLGFLRQLKRELVSDEERESSIARTSAAIVSIVSPKLIFVFGSAVSADKFESESDIDCLIGELAGSSAHRMQPFHAYAICENS